MTIQQFINEDQGATAVEYGTISAGICLACIASLAGVATALNTTFNFLAAGLAG